MAGFRDRKPTDRASIIRALNGLSQMIIDFPCIVATDINPLLSDPAGRCGRLSSFLIKVTPEDLRLRFCSSGTPFSDKLLRRMTQLDYDRDMVLVALDTNDVALCGVARLLCDPEHGTAEYAILVRSDLKGHGLGWTMLHLLIEYGHERGLKRVEGVVLQENARMLEMCRETGFEVASNPAHHRIINTSLNLADIKTRR